MTTLLGKTDIGATDGGNLDFSIYSRFQCIADGVVDTLKFRMGIDHGTWLRLAILSDNAGAVEHVLGQGVVTTLTENTWLEVTGLSVAVTKDTYYWLAARLDGYFKYDAGSRGYKSYTGNNAFTDHPTITGYDNNASISMYATGSATTNIDIAGALATADGAAPVPAVTAGTSVEIAAAVATASGAALVPALAIGITIDGVVATGAGAAPIPAINIWGGSEVPPSWGDGLALAPTITADAQITATLAAGSGAAPVAAFSAASDIDASAATAVGVFLTAQGPNGHIVIEAIYFIEAPDVNRAYVIGADDSGVEVTGNAQTAADLALVGERLEVKHDSAIPTAEVAAAVATAILSAARLNSKRAHAVIPPHCGLELWDVLTIIDDGANQSTTYRASGYILDYDTRLAIYRHTITLCAP
jgi:hypothetical protein